MYAVSDKYLEAIHLAERYVDIKGRITFKNGAVVAVSNNTFQEASLYINKKAVDSDDLNAGSVYASELGVSVFYNKSDYKSFIGAKIELYFGIELTLGQEDFEYVPLGAYYVDTAEKGQGVVKLIAYDSMLKFDKEYSYKGKQATIYGHLSDICSKCGVTLGMSKTDVEKLPSGNTAPVINPENLVGRYTPCETYRDAISIIAAHSGSFAYIGRDNKLYLKQIKNEAPVYKLTNEQIFSAKIIDCSPNITLVSYTTKNNKDISVGNETGRKFIVDTDNQFFENGGEKEISRILTQIYNSMGSISYYPSEITWSGDPALDLGDYILLPEYEGGCKTYITGINWKYRGKSKILSAGKENSLSVRSNLSGSIAGIVDGLNDLNKTVQEIASGGGKSDHYTTTANYFDKLIKTESRITKIVYEESEETE